MISIQTKAASVRLCRCVFSGAVTICVVVVYNSDSDAWFLFVIFRSLYLSEIQRVFYHKWSLHFFYYLALAYTYINIIIQICVFVWCCNTRLLNIFCHSDRPMSPAVYLYIFVDICDNIISHTHAQWSPDYKIIDTNIYLYNNIICIHFNIIIIIITIRFSTKDKKYNETTHFFSISLRHRQNILYVYACIYFVDMWNAEFELWSCPSIFFCPTKC